MTKDKTLLSIEKWENTHFQYGKLAIFFFIFCSLILVSLFRGTKRSPSIVGITRCSAGDWIVFILFILAIIAVSIFSSVFLMLNHKRKVKHGYEFVKGDMKWTPVKIASLIGIAFIAGLLASMLGLGGGVVFNPLLLELGILPIVASATGMYMVMVSTFVNTILYAFAGFLNYGFAFWQAAFTLVGTVIGMIAVKKALKKTGRPSILVILLSVVIIFTAIVIIINSTITLIEDMGAGKNVWKFTWMCDT